MSNACEIFKLLLHKCPNHNMSLMDQLSDFMKGLITTIPMLIVSSVGGAMRENIDEEVNTLIENMYRNEYHSSGQGVKGKGVLVVNIQTALLAHMENVTK